MANVDVRTFQPKEGGTTVVTNSASATAAVTIPYDCDTVVLTNSSASAIVFVRVTQFLDSTAPTGEAPTTTADMPILPLSQIRRGVGEGNKVIRTIASAADGNLYITPGKGS